ncbi:hypothetical protein CONCODRAFT_7355 [Conidiobolus coronatus NRRL 28638]|uniref:Uncharacterized protein n=1 Tax=Conidiobolus coronatus (strain ATCC 28846 / CBS 209.66 / NRRL 28638) TaxID=796925 RepID=A0A137P529_CONC2|nr:hypothetical protein CONCODRAFT_7355 [Conidiobolus coronatus NRRL 28638]|eukprot:KXN70117.1 hypothetical protein CONCODRAFT_7355 [Conidiobolus coronatus NRRL 28638]
MEEYYQKGVDLDLDCGLLEKEDELRELRPISRNVTFTEVRLYHYYRLNGIIRVIGRCKTIRVIRMWVKLSKASVEESLSLCLWNAFLSSDHFLEEDIGKTSNIDRSNNLLENGDKGGTIAVENEDTPVYGPQLYCIAYKLDGVEHMQYNDFRMQSSTEYPKPIPTLTLLSSPTSSTQLTISQTSFAPIPTKIQVLSELSNCIGKCLTT